MRCRDWEERIAADLEDPAVREHLADCDTAPEGPDPEMVLYRRTMTVQRATLIELRNRAQITDELLRKLERELDLEESRIPV